MSPLQFSMMGDIEAIIVGIAGFGFVATALLGTGEFISRRLFKEWDLGAPEILLLGALAWSQGVFLCAWLGLWRPMIGAAILLPWALAGVATVRRIPWSHLRSLWPIFPAALIFLATLGTPTIFWDSRAYHLAIPEHVAIRGALIASPSYAFAWYPQAMECLYVLSAPFGDAAARLLNALFLVAAAKVAARAARSPLAASLFLSMPGVLLLAYVPKNVGLFALAGILALEHGLKAERDDDGRRHAWISGIACGLALATHYAALWILPFLLPLIWRRTGPASRARFLLGAMISAAPTYLRNLVEMHNPFYPFFANLFGTVPTLSTQAAQFPNPALFFERLLVAPWAGVEALGIGSTLGLVLPAGLILALLFRRERPVQEMALRFGIGFGLLSIGITLYGFTRFGIAGLLFLLPVAVAGLNRWQRAAEWACTLYALAGALMLLNGPFDPISAYRIGPERYREQFDNAWVLTPVARALPETARVASVGILRSQGWGARLEPAGEDYLPALADALADSNPGQALRRKGYTHLAIDDLELSRLQRQYGYLVLDESAERKFRELLEHSRRLENNRGQAALFELP